jgi:hypothetical protein
MNILTVNLLCNTFVFWVAARMYLALPAMAAIPAVVGNLSGGPAGHGGPA